MFSTVDAVFALEGLAAALEKLPDDEDSQAMRFRARVVQEARQVAQAVGKEHFNKQALADARSYAGDDWEHNVLLALLGGKGAQKALGFE